MEQSPPNRRILALDGGGIKGVFPASFLATIDQGLSHPLGEYFDLIAGTSTGGIIALALGLRIPASDILTFYQKHGPRIFGNQTFFATLRSIITSKHDTQPLRESLEEVFGTSKLGDSRSRLVIPSFNVDSGEVHIYKTAHDHSLRTDYPTPAVEVALATSAAPYYFAPYRFASGSLLVDGGIWANNPTGLAVVEAVALLGWDPSSLLVLSIGCTTPPFDIGVRKYLGWGVFTWAFRAVDLFMYGQSSASIGTAKLFVRDKLHRINPVVPHGRFGLDSIKNLDTLRGLGHSEARKAGPKLYETFFNTPAEAFVPIYRERD